MSHSIALLQLNPIVGNISGNRDMIEIANRLAAGFGADFAVTPELAISGYPPRDILESSGFVDGCILAASQLKTSIPLLLGTPLLAADSRSLIGNGVNLIQPEIGVVEIGRKRLLPTYDVFDEKRYFDSGNAPSTATLDDICIGVTVCEDAWQHSNAVPNDYADDPILDLAKIDGLSCTINLSASPWHQTHAKTRLEVARHAAKTLGHPFLICNQAGGNDDLLFDGRSVAAWPDGRAVMAPAWCQGVLLVDLESPKKARWLPGLDGKCSDKCPCKLILLAPEEVPKEEERGQELLNAISIGLGDYCKKSGIKKLVLGLSGGIDSAVTAALAAKAVGPRNVVGLMMPSKYSSEHSITDAQYTADALGIESLLLPIEKVHTEAEELLSEELENGHPVAGENVQARLRGMLVMGVANARNAMALATGNKSELAQGYCTLYGDMAGGYAPLGDLYKMEVYEVAKALNAESGLWGARPPINQSTMSKVPSAELAPNQVDEDTLPPYQLLDEILRLHMEEGLEGERILTRILACPIMISLRDVDLELIEEVLDRLYGSEHKRRQMPPAPRASKKAFGQGWRQPLAAKRDFKR